MERWNIFLVPLCLVVSVLPTVCGQLSTNEKQALLDLHNELRGAAGGADIVQSVSTGRDRNSISFARVSDWLLRMVSAGMGSRTGRNCTEVCGGMPLQPQSVCDHCERGTPR